jgi:hypothetical protein
MCDLRILVMRSKMTIIFTILLVISVPEEEAYVIRPPD